MACGSQWLAYRRPIDFMMAGIKILQELRSGGCLPVGV